MGLIGFPKGQSSVEFLSIVGIALVISAPFMLSAQQSLIDIERSSEAITLQKSMDKLEESVSTVSVSGEPARRTFLMELPDNVEKARIVQDRAVVYTLDRSSGKTNVSRIFDTNISAPGDLPNSTKRIGVYAWNDQVNISEVK